MWRHIFTNGTSGHGQGNLTSLTTSKKTLLGISWRHHHTTFLLLIGSTTFENCRSERSSSHMWRREGVSADQHWLFVGDGFGQLWLGRDWDNLTWLDWILWLSWRPSLWRFLIEILGMSWSPLTVVLKLGFCKSTLWLWSNLMCSLSTVLTEFDWGMGIKLSFLEEFDCWLLTG